MKFLAFVFLVSSLSFAQNSRPDSISVPQAKESTAEHALKDTNRLKLVLSFQKSRAAMAAVQSRAMELCHATPDCEKLWQTYQADVNGTNALASTVAADEKLPVGTQFSVDIDQETVAVSLPEPPKQEPKK